MTTYKAKAVASASVVAQFFFRPEETVTATASATAESNISEEDAYNIALQIAQDVANSAAQNDANVLIQSVNTSTLGDTTIFLSSSLLKDIVEKVGDNEYRLVKNLTFINPFRLIIKPNETLIIDKGFTAKTRLDSFGKINVEGTLEIGGIQLDSSKDLNVVQVPVNSKNINLKATSETLPSTINGPKSCAVGSILNISVGETCNITSTGSISCTGATINIGTSTDVSTGTRLNNSGTITGVGISSINNYGTLNNTSTGTIDIAIINNQAVITNVNSITAYNYLIQSQNSTTTTVPSFVNSSTLNCGIIYNPSIEYTIQNTGSGKITIS